MIARYSVPAGQPWRRHCPACGKELTWSAYLPSARCGQCRAPVGAAAYAVEAALAIVLALLVAGPRDVLELPAYCWFAGVGVTLAFVDAAVRRLPNHLTGAWAGGLLAGLALPAVLDHRADDWLRALLGGLVLAGVFAVIALVRPGAMGWGDVKAALAVGAALGWLSWAAVYAGVFLAFLLASAYALVLLARGRAARSTKLPMGPFLFIGAFIVLALP